MIFCSGVQFVPIDVFQGITDDVAAKFLSMKLATINPRMDFNIEGLLAKDIIQSRAGPSSALGCHPDMSLPYAPLHPSQPGLIQTGLPGMGTSSDALRRTISSHLTAMSGGYKEPTSQAPNVWEDELHNIVQMGLNSSISLDGQDLDDNYVSLAFLQDRIFFLLLLYGPLPWVPDYSIVAKIKSDEREDLKVLATGVAAALTARKVNCKS